MWHSVRSSARIIATGVAFLALVGSASAQSAHPATHSPRTSKLSLGSHQPDCPGKNVNPVFESLYIKQFCGPKVNCGTCFGFYRTQWQPWHEACGEPAPFNPGPRITPVEPEVEEAKSPEKLDTPSIPKEPEKQAPVEKKTPAEKSSVDKARSGQTAAHLQLPITLPEIEAPRASSTPGALTIPPIPFAELPIPPVKPRNN